MLLNYRQYSDQGKPLLILHGLFGSLANWGWHSKQFAEHFAVIGVDLRNHGESFHAEEMNYQVMAADVKRLMQELQIDSCYMIGHSMGGKVAMQIALSDPDLIDRLIVVDIAPVAYPDKADGHRRVLTGMQEVDASSIKNRADAEQQLLDYIEDEATRRFVLTNLVRQENGQYRWRLNIDAIDRHYDQLREKPVGDQAFHKPTLFVKGDLSRYIQKKHEPEILELFPAAEVKIIMETGHWLHAEKPQVFQKIALDFLLREQE